MPAANEATTGKRDEESLMVGLQNWICGRCTSAAPRRCQLRRFALLGHAIGHRPYDTKFSYRHTTFTFHMGSRKSVGDDSDMLDLV
jgi:hypothetical protein